MVLEVVWVVATVVAVCSSGRVPVRIIGGTDAEPGQFPWQVALEIGTGAGRALCGGSLINNGKHVLTAGHCMRDLSNGNQNQNPSRIKVIPGVNRNSASGRRDVLRFWVEPSYSTRTPQRRRIDLAILELESAAVAGENAAAVPLCEEGECGAPGTGLAVSGYGQTVSDVASSVSSTLQWASLTAVGQAECATKFETNFGCSDCLPVTNVCAQSDPADAEPNKDSCFGDSGGPLVQSVAGASKLWGVVSTGTVPGNESPSCGKPGEYGVYVSVPPNAPWIQSVLRGERDSEAIDSSCVAAGTCAGDSFFPFFPWFNSGAVLRPLLWLAVTAVCAAAL